MRCARIAEPWSDRRAVGGRFVLDQLDPMAGAFDIRDLEFDALNAGHGRKQLLVARTPRDLLETQPIDKKG